MSFFLPFFKKNTLISRFYYVWSINLRFIPEGVAVFCFKGAAMLPKVPLVSENYSSLRVISIHFLQDNLNELKDSSTKVWIF